MYSRILGIGVDLLHLPRLSKILINRDPLRLATRICTPQELHQYRQLSPTSPAAESFLALRWTAKEAAYKALYPHFRLSWKDLELTKVDKKPFLGFSPAFLARLEVVRTGEVEREDVEMHVSVSHDGGMMTAYVVVERKG